jgi:hypothetical protein
MMQKTQRIQIETDWRGTGVEGEGEGEGEGVGASGGARRGKAWDPAANPDDHDPGQL